MHNFNKYFNEHTWKTAKVLVPLIVAFIVFTKFLSDDLGLTWLQTSLSVSALLLIVIPVISYLNLKRLESQLPILTVKRELKKETQKIKDLTSGMVKKSDIYKLRLISYRFGVELSKYSSMSEGAYKQFCLNERMYFMYIFRSALDILRKGDVYRTVTTIDIWLNDEKDVELRKLFPGVPNEYRKSLLKANIEAAKRKVEIERYFIVNKEGMEDQSSSYHANLRTLVQRLVNALDDDVKNCDIFFCPTSDYVNETAKDIAFSLIRNEEYDTYMYLKSDMSNPKLPFVQMNFLDSSNEEVYQKLYEKLEAYRNKSSSNKLTLKQMATRLNIKKN